MHFHIQLVSVLQFVLSSRNSELYFKIIGVVPLGYIKIQHTFSHSTDNKLQTLHSPATRGQHDSVRKKTTLLEQQPTQSDEVSIADVKFEFEVSKYKMRVHKMHRLDMRRSGVFGLLSLL